MENKSEIHNIDNRKNNINLQSMENNSRFVNIDNSKDFHFNNDDFNSNIPLNNPNEIQNYDFINHPNESNDFNINITNIDNHSKSYLNNNNENDFQTLESFDLNINKLYTKNVERLKNLTKIDDD